MIFPILKFFEKSCFEYEPNEKIQTDFTKSLPDKITKKRVTSGFNRYLFKSLNIIYEPSDVNTFKHFLIDCWLYNPENMWSNLCNKINKIWNLPKICEKEISYFSDQRVSRCATKACYTSHPDHEPRILNDLCISKR